MFNRVVTMAAVASLAFTGTSYAAPEIGPVVKHVVTSHIDANGGVTDPNGVDIIDPDFGPGPANYDHDFGTHIGPKGGEKFGGDVFNPLPTPEDIVKAVILNKIEQTHGTFGDANSPMPDIFAAEDVGIPTFVWIEAFIEALDPYIDRDSETDANGSTFKEGPADVRAIKVIRAVKTHMDRMGATCGTLSPERGEAAQPELDPRTQFCVNRSISLAETSLDDCQATNGDLCYKNSAELLFEDMSGCFEAPAP